jgi:hypothetical protein
MSGRRAEVPVTSPARVERALVLAGVAILGLVVTPLLHAEEHWREEHSADAEALAEAWRAGSTDPLDRLALLLQHGREPQRSQPGAHHGRAPGDHDGPGHRHSHGPSRPGPHGAGALAHLALALHSAPQLPDLAIPAAEHAPPAALVAQRDSAVPYLVPEWSQGPPSRC